MTAGLEAALAARLAGEVRFDPYTRHLFSTDASLYAIEPLGVAFPRNADDVAAAVEVAGAFGVPVLPRGAGTSLAGQTVGRAVVLDMSRFMHRLVSVDAELRTARVQPGLVQDELNAAAAQHGLMFAPDTSTANRATLGGMIGNNSCGARSARYGMTIDHVHALDVVLSDGSRSRFEPLDAGAVAHRAAGGSLDACLHRDVPRLLRQYDDAIRRDFPPYWRQSAGYRLDRMLPERGPFNLASLVVGSEGTLAIVVGADVRLVPLPKAVVGVAGHFTSVAAAIDAAADARACGAAAIELVDRFILNLARQSPAHRTLLSILDGDPAALLWVEFYGDTPPEAGALAERLQGQWRAHGHAYAVHRADSRENLARFRELRRAGLGLLAAAGTGGERSVAFVEDTAVPPERLAPYTQRLAAILARHNLTAGFYGHASAGCLHIRPFMDLTRPSAVVTLRAVADEVCALVTEFGGNNSSEHGDGLARGEFNRRIFGETLYGAMKELKQLFDPSDRLNPGKKVDVPRLTAHLRDPALPKGAPVATHFRFDHDDGMRGVANRCARIGACRKSEVAGRTMCPSFRATRDEQHSTRGRANALVHALSSPDPRVALGDKGLSDVLDLCLECKACQTECPLAVDMATLKAEFLSQYQARHGVPLRARLFGHARALNRVGSALAPLANWLARSPRVRVIAERWIGIDRRRPLPLFAREALRSWFKRTVRLRPTGGTAKRGPVVFLADSFTSFTEPGIGKAAIELLELAGWEVELADGVCCGRSLISKGLLKEARSRQQELVARLAPRARKGVPIVGCEPSCIFTLTDELPRLLHDDPGAADVARAAKLVEELIVQAIDAGDLIVERPLAGWAPAFAGATAEGAGATAPPRVLFHAHCHQKAANATAASIELLQRIPGVTVDVLDAGCCGMAGSFGFEREHYDLSMEIGGLRLFPAITGAPDAIVAATGTSCRQQVAHGTGRPAAHPVSLVRSLVHLAPPAREA